MSDAFANLGAEIEATEKALQNFVLTPELISSVQTFLKAAGHDPGPIDGILGPNTIRALRKWQKANGLPESETLDAIAYSQIDSAMRRLMAGPTGADVSPQDAHLVNRFAPEDSRAHDAIKSVPDPAPAPAPKAPAPAGPGGGAGAAAPAPAAPASPPPDLYAPLPNATEEEIIKEIRKRFGHMAWMLDHPDVGPILRRAVREGLGLEDVKALIFRTPWYQTTSASARRWEELLHTDPAEAHRQKEAAKLFIRNSARRLGVVLDEERIAEMADSYIRFAWQPQDLQAALSAEIDYDRTAAGEVDPASQLAAWSQTLEKLSEDYLVPLTGQTEAEMLKRLVEGTIDETMLVSFFTQQAKSRFPHLAEYLDAGITLKNFFSPYIEQIARTLEISPGEVDLLDDPKFARIIETVDANGKRRPMTISEAMVYVRGLPEFDRTAQARDLAASYGEEIARMFGRSA